MKSRLKNIIRSILAFVIISGCSQTDSTNIATAGLYADMKVTSFADGSADVMVALQVGAGISATRVELGMGDKLEASVNGGTPKLLGKKGSSFIGDTRYETTFNGVNSQDVIILNFQRSEHVDAPNSTVSIPPFLDVTQPDNVTAGDIFKVFWGNNSDGCCTVDIGFKMECELSGNSILTKYVTFSSLTDDGESQSYLVDELLNGVSDPITCPTALTVTRWQDGTIDPNFGEGGNIWGKQKRVVYFTINP